jgi:hypothetical protein
MSFMNRVSISLRTLDRDCFSFLDVRGDLLGGAGHCLEMLLLRFFSENVLSSKADWFGNGVGTVPLIAEERGGECWGGENAATVLLLLLVTTNGDEDKYSREFADKLARSCCELLQFVFSCWNAICE